jgi:LuxR family maltose regulon positive regulatory protein
MLSPILSTKLFMPAQRSGAISRRRLLDRFTENGADGAGKALTLISAPAGFGKTTLVSEWAASSGRHIAWLSLDEEDGDPPRFLLYVAAALHSVEPSCGVTAIATLQSPQPPSLETIFYELLNEVNDASCDILLVLEDYHTVSSPVVDATVSLLFEHPTPRLRVAITTREDPRLPLARMRARGELCELRADDLRFTPTEAADFLSHTMGLDVREEDIAALESRTEGWIAGLQLAALSIRGERNVAGFIGNFVGSDRFALDYLAEEVLQRQPDEIQNFLLRTSILDRLCGPLCDAVSGCSGGQATLEYLERSNLFIVPLDGERKWYRYHRLFAELLRQRLAYASGTPQGTAALHIRASAWLEDSGYLIEAFRHAVVSGDIDLAERIAESRAMPIHSRIALDPIIRWLAGLPPELLDTRPSLRVLLGTMSLVAGRTSGVDDCLDAAERGLGGVEADSASRKLLGRIAAARATLALTHAQFEIIEAESSRALELLPDDDLPFRFTAFWTKGFACAHLGDRDAAKRFYAEAIEVCRKSGDTFSMQIALCRTAEMQKLDNRLRESAATYRHALELFGEHPHPSASEAHLGLAQVLYEWNDLDAAEEEGERSLQFALQYDRVIDRFVACELFLARVTLARGQVKSAMARLEALKLTVQSRDFQHCLPEIAAQEALVLLRNGEVEGAARLAERYDLPQIKTRVWLADGQANEALGQLESMLLQAEAKGEVDEALRLRVIRALALAATGREDDALGEICEAANAAEANGFIRLFLDEGAVMDQLFSVAARRGLFAAVGIAPDYIKDILASFAAEREAISRGVRGSMRLGSGIRSNPLATSLSERELEVLKLISEGLSNQEIGDRLFIATDTVKGHNQRIFDKLGVKRRTEAIARARELWLL